MFHFKGYIRKNGKNLAIFEFKPHKTKLPLELTYEQVLALHEIQQEMSPKMHTGASFESKRVLDQWPGKTRSKS